MTRLTTAQIEHYHEQGWIVPDYRVPEALHGRVRLGSRVAVSFARRKVAGFARCRPPRDSCDDAAQCSCESWDSQFPRLSSGNAADVTLIQEQNGFDFAGVAHRTTDRSRF